MKKDIVLNWLNAHAWEAKANSGKTDNEPKWQWDCNFKLDFDGPLFSIGGRFYPPGKKYGEGWDGGIDIMVIGESVITKDFKCETLDELKNEVEAFVKAFVNEYAAKIKQLIMQ